MELHTIIENQLECVSSLNRNITTEDNQQDWCACARTISEEKWINAALATEQQSYDQEKGTNTYEPINLLNYRMELFELADLMLEKERMKEFLAKGKPQKWQHFNYWADYEISKLIDWHGSEWMAEKADLLLRGDNGIHWRDRQRFRNKWGC